MGSNKTAWKNARLRAALLLAPEGRSLSEIKPLPYRIHDLRHTLQTKMRNKNVPLEKTAIILGWSPAQTVRMARIYGHYSLDDLREAVES